MAGHHHEHPPDHEQPAYSILPDIIYTRDPAEPRYFAKPGQTVRSNTPSRAATWFSVAIILFVLALFVVAIISPIAGR